MKLRRDLDWVAEDIISSYEAAAAEDQLNFWFDWKGSGLLTEYAFEKMQDAEAVFPDDIEEKYREKYGDEFIVEKWGT